MTTMIIVFAILIGLFLGLAIYTTIQEIEGVREAMWFIVGGTLGVAIVSIFIECYPSAMDVYQGKTELEYTVRGNEVVDSVVVYKKLLEE